MPASFDDVPVTLSDRVNDAKELAEKEPAQAVAVVEKLLDEPVDVTDPASLRGLEQSILLLGQIYLKLHQAESIANLIRHIRPKLSIFSKAKTTKIVRTLIDDLSDIPDAGALQVSLCKEMIEWSKTENSTYLKQSLETRLVALYLHNKQFSEALALIATLLRELKRLDDKMMLVEVQLLESRACHELRNIPKARAALTAARTSANAMYTPPLTQAALDIQSGILHAEEKDFKTAFSYFYEALEGFSSQDDPRAISSLKYMILCKIMINSSEDVVHIVNSKTALRHAGHEVEAMRAVAKAAQNRSLKEFEAAIKDHPKELSEDTIIKSHLNDLYSTLLEQNLNRIIEPFSHVEVAHVAELIDLPVKQVENKLSQMILDKKFRGIVDQGEGCLIVFDEPQQDKTYETSLATVESMGKVVNALFVKTSKLS